VTFKTWQDITAGEAELNYMRTALKFCDECLMFGWLHELEDSDPGKIRVHAKWGKPMSHNLKLAVTLTVGELGCYFDEKQFDTLMQLIGLSR
jgi:cell division inhibitor SulA